MTFASVHNGGYQQNQVDLAEPSDVIMPAFFPSSQRGWCYYISSVLLIAAAVVINLKMRTAIFCMDSDNSEWHISDYCEFSS